MCPGCDKEVLTIFWYWYRFMFSSSLFTCILFFGGSGYRNWSYLPILKKLHELLFSIVFNSFHHMGVTWFNFSPPVHSPHNNASVPTMFQVLFYAPGISHGKDTIPILTELTLKYVSYFRYYWKFNLFKTFPITNNFQ